MPLSQSKLARLTPNLGILWISVCFFWLCESIVANPIIYRLVSSPSRYETRQWRLQRRLDSGVLQKFSECSVWEQCVPFVASPIRGRRSKEALPLKTGDKDEKSTMEQNFRWEVFTGKTWIITWLWVSGQITTLHIRSPQNTFLVFFSRFVCLYKKLKRHVSRKKKLLRARKKLQIEVKWNITYLIFRAYFVISRMAKITHHLYLHLQHSL